MSDADIRIIVRGQHAAKGKSAIIALIEGMLSDRGFKSVIVDDPDADQSRRHHLRRAMLVGERDDILELRIVVEYQQAARTEDT